MKLKDFTRYAKSMEEPKTGGLSLPDLDRINPLTAALPSPYSEFRKYLQEQMERESQVEQMQKRELAHQAKMAQMQRLPQSLVDEFRSYAGLGFADKGAKLFGL